MGNHGALKHNLIEWFEVLSHWLTIFLLDGLQVVAPAILWLGAQELSNELFLKLLKAGDHPCAQPPNYA